MVDMYRKPSTLTLILTCLLSWAATSFAAGCDTRPTLSIATGGTRPADTKELQRLLNANNAGPAPGGFLSALLPHLNVDGNFGPGTSSAVVQYQQQQGLPATGIVDADTWTALCGAPPPSAPSVAGAAASVTVAAACRRAALLNRASAALCKQQTPQPSRDAGSAAAVAGLGKAKGGAVYGAGATSFQPNQCTVWHSDVASC